MLITEICEKVYGYAKDFLEYILMTYLVINFHYFISDIIGHIML